MIINDRVLYYIWPISDLTLLDPHYMLAQLEVYNALNGLCPFSCYRRRLLLR